MLFRSVDLNLANTSLFSSEETNDSKYGDALQFGILIPFKRFVFSGYGNLTAVSFNEFYLGNSFNFKFGLAKEITDKLTVGTNLNSGIYWAEGESDWGLSVNLGFVYTYGDLAFMKDFRFGASILNLGKNYTPEAPIGVKNMAATSLPSIAVIKAGVAGTLVQNDVIKLGFSADLSTPYFMNFIADLGLQFSIKDMFFISVAEKLNLVELSHDVKNLLPSVGLIFRFTLDVKNNEYLSKNGWSQSEMSANAAWKQFNESVNAVSYGVDVNLGLKDKAPPVIQL